MLGGGLPVNARHYVDLFELVDAWPDAPKRLLVLLAQFEIQARFIDFAWNPDFCDSCAAELIVHLVRDPSTPARVGTILLALLRNFCECKGGDEYLDCLSSHGLFDHITAFFQRCSGPEQFKTLIEFVGARALRDPQSVGLLLEAVPFGRFLENEETRDPMIRMFENVLLKSEISDTSVTPILDLLEAFCSVSDVSCVFRLVRLLARLCQNPRYLSFVASFSELFGEWFDCFAQSDDQLMDQFAVMVSHFLECDLGRLAPLIERFVQTADAGKGTFLLVSTLTEIIKSEFGSAWRHQSDMLFRWIVDRLDWEISAQEIATVIRCLVSLIRFVAPDIVSQNAAPILDLFHRLVHCDSPKMLIGVMYGLIELQDIEDALGTNRQMLVDFMAEEGEAFDEVLDREFGDSQGALQVLLDIVNERLQQEE
jgi:hypothetical protein